MLNQIKRNNRIYKKKVLGRGIGSGKGGHTVGRGSKGQSSRTGHKSLIFFEGGNVPLYKRLPKYHGFKSLNKVDVQPVNVTQLQEAFEANDVVNLNTLKEKKLIKQRAVAAKILGVGEITKPLTIEGLSVSESAKSKILASKGSIK
ncbi:MAG TPA: 50S ribosomal protein L15 [Candidatus Dojkabacteria bacterium]|nr:50S ribosomal protein L15 [Candidatus Dojkabacteria bacterium]HQG57847.1 50S ribosomal protein L15 [Candidatus Dojkabacteria bacterium]